VPSDRRRKRVPRKTGVKINVWAFKKNRPMQEREDFWVGRRGNRECKNRGLNKALEDRRGGKGKGQHGEAMSSGNPA